MAYVLAIEANQEQADILRQGVGSKAAAQLTVVDSVDAALAAIDERVPGLILVSPLMARHDERELLARLQTLPTDTAQPQILFTPALACPERPPLRRTLLGRMRNPMIEPAGCDPSAFADQLLIYLNQADRRPRAESVVPQVDLVPAPLPLALPIAAAVPGPVTLTKSGADRRAAVRLERLSWARALVDGAAVDLIDLSFTGAQVVAPMVLQPGGTVHVELSRGSRAVRCEAGIVWGGFELVGDSDGPLFRAGMHFKDADQSVVERFYFGRD